ncbi:MAG: quinone-dependent dihydroorotate dehydrogenase [Thermomicrobiales bacterium]|nr:quinone-dependent dihydroorotate dehydrogenase [Thermomicrobiales bacterium]
MNPYRLVRPLLYRFDAETTHERVLAGLARVSAISPVIEAVRAVERFDDPRLAVSLFGQRFPSPIAVAAGLDKNGVAVPAFDALGFAFVEVGTVPPNPQAGNERPRVFRLPVDAALINRMGFPSEGMEAVASHLAERRGRGRFALNVGPNKDRIDHAADDCLAVIERLAEFNPVYVVVNVSSPNTARLRDLQGRDALHRLLSDVRDGRSDRARTIPLLVKIAPDLTDAELDDVLQVVSDLALPGIVATNTTVARPEGLRDEARQQQGGLSGRPLREPATRMIARIHERGASRLTIIAAGGVFDGADALDKIGAGATIVQTYTGMVYEGPGLAKRIKQRMAEVLEMQGIASLESIRGTGYRAPRG